MKKFQGHLYETNASWHPVIIHGSTNWMDNVIHRPSWLSEHCPDADNDYDAWCHPDDQLTDHDHRTVYFFRDEQVAIQFALRWS